MATSYEPSNLEHADQSGSLWVDGQFKPLFDRNGIQRLQDLFSFPPSVVLSKPALPSWRERIAIDLQDDQGASHRFYVKRFLEPPWREQWRRIRSGHAKRSTAGVEKHWIESISSAGVAVPQVAAFGESRRGVREQRSAVVLAEVPGKSLETIANAPNATVSPSMIDALADLVAAFHRGGFIHRDLYLCHVFCENPGDHEPRLRLIDLQRVMQSPIRRRRWIVRDLAQLNYSTPQNLVGLRDRLRWLKKYWGTKSLHGHEYRSIMRDIERKTCQIARHDARRTKRIEMQQEKV